MNILVTGASGFLGRFLVKKLRNEGHNVYEINSKNCDLTKESSLYNAFEQKFDRIYHLAAWTQAGDFCLYHPGAQWLINQKINTNVLDWWQKAQPQAKMICMGTSCVYDPSLPLSEEYYLTGKPIDSLFTYAMTKKMLLVGLQSLNKQYGLNYLYLIPSTLYGADYHTDGRQLHFIFDLIRKIIRGLLYQEPVILWGDGEQKRELIHVDDFVEVLLQLSAKVENTIVNIGSGKEHSIKEFAGMICNYLGYDFDKIHFDTSKYVGARSKVLSVEKLHSLLPEHSYIPLEKGLNETIQWCLDHHQLLERAKC